jgi:hypothetical protein
VTVLPEKKALSIMGRGLAYVDDMSSFRESGRSGELTIEMAVLADNHSASGFRSLLMLHDGSDKRQLFVGQWKKSIVIMNGDDYDYTRKRPRLSGNDVFSTEFIRLITVTADGQGTRLYVDGSLVDAVKNWQLKMPQRGQRGQLRINDFR